jgi:hypothetical protein
MAHGPLFSLADAEQEASIECGDHAVHVGHMIVTSEPGLGALVLPPVSYDDTNPLAVWAANWVCQRRPMIQGEML